MEFTPSPSSIFQNKEIKYNNKKPTKNGIRLKINALFVAPAYQFARQKL